MLETKKRSDNYNILNTSVFNYYIKIVRGHMSTLLLDLQLFFHIRQSLNMRDNKRFRFLTINSGGQILPGKTRVGLLVHTVSSAITKVEQKPEYNHTY